VSSTVAAEPTDRSTPDASVIVPTHRGAHRLPILLEALAAQTYSGAWEVVLVVDGVLDETPDLAAAYADRVPLRLVVSQEPRGTCHALNDGYAAASGRVLIRCDDDLTPGPEMVARHVAWHEGPEPRGIIGATRDVFPDTPYSRVYGRPANERALVASYRRPADQLWVNWAAHNSVTRESWDRAGGFDERFVYGQDGELGWRLHQAGLTLHIDPALAIAHRGPTISARTRVPRAYVAGASRRLFAVVHPAADQPDQPPTTLASRVWSAGTAAFGWAVRTREGYRKIGSLVDRLLRVLPSAVGSRLVAFCVEAAGRSGLRWGPTDLALFQDQKAREVASELRTPS
jgi:GT2 family glycosyltransferase